MAVIFVIGLGFGVYILIFKRENCVTCFSRREQPCREVCRTDDAEEQPPTYDEVVKGTIWHSQHVPPTTSETRTSRQNEVNIQIGESNIPNQGTELTKPVWQRQQKLSFGNQNLLDEMHTRPKCKYFKHNYISSLQPFHSISQCVLSLNFGQISVFEKLLFPHRENSQWSHCGIEKVFSKILGFRWSSVNLFVSWVIVYIYLNVDIKFAFYSHSVDFLKSRVML